MAENVWRVFLLVGVIGIASCGYEPDEPLTIAAAAGRTAELETLLANGADVDGEDGSGLTPLAWAACRTPKRSGRCWKPIAASRSARTSGLGSLWPKPSSEAARNW